MPDALPISAHRSAVREQRIVSEGKPASTPPAPLRFVIPPELQGQPIPERAWIVQDWLPVGCVTLLYGDGGTGKSLLAQQLMTACATGTPWLGLAVTRCHALGLFCEDSEAELHRRQDSINRGLDLEFDDLAAMRWASAIGADNALMRFQSDGTPERTERLTELVQHITDFAAGLVILDTAADLFGGNENDRAQVRSFIGTLNHIAEDKHLAIVLNAHPSRSGMSKDGDMDGGSTGWSNTARARWSLHRPVAEDGADPDTTERIITRRKSNYSSIGETMRLRWGNGVLAPVVRPTGFAGMAAEADADAVFLALLAKADAGNLPVSASGNAHNFAPKIFAARPDRQGMGRREFDSAMQRLLAAGKITLVNYGRKGDERRRLALPESVGNV